MPLTICTGWLEHWSQQKKLNLKHIFHFWKAVKREGNSSTMNKHIYGNTDPYEPKDNP